MILVADGGSTKCAWAIVNSSTKEIEHTFQTDGINPFSRSREEIRQVLEAETASQTSAWEIEAVYFYGAGAAWEGATLLCEEIQHICPQATIHIGSDMEGAARATIQDGDGIVCILGTGSNTCYYENGERSSKVPSLGYILGDEGSGNALGRMIVSDVLKGVAPDHISRDFTHLYSISEASVLENVYRKPMATRYLASFAPFLSARLSDPYVHSLVTSCFENLLERAIRQYPKSRIYFVGSVAKHFETVLREVFSAGGYEIGGICQSPLEGIAAYHAGRIGAPRPEQSTPSAKEAFRKITEEASYYNDIDKMSVREILRSINREDHRVADAVEKALPSVEKLVTQLIERMKQGGRLFYMGAGTSGRLGVLDASEIPPTFGMPPTLVIGLIAGGDKALRTPVEGAEDDTQQGWKDILNFNPTPLDTVVGIAASGTTPYVIGALRDARAHGLLTASIASNPDSPIAHEAEIAIEMIVGAEFVTGSSRMKSGTGQKLICNMITTATMIGLGRVRGNRMVNMQLSNKKLVDRGTRMLVDFLGLEYDKAKQLLLIHGSAQKAIEAYQKEHGVNSQA